MSTDTANTIWYTRCPVPTASGIAYQRGMFDTAFAGTGFVVRNIRDAGGGKGGLNTHFSHTLANSFREGGGSPPVWARANGADTSLLGVSFIEETLGLFVRSDADIERVEDLAGKRCALPVWPELIMNFFRFAALKAFDSALRLHDMTPADVRFVDVTETGDHFALLNPAFASGQKRQMNSYYNCQMQALLNGEVDAIFAKGGEIAVMLEESGGGIRMLYNLIDAGPLWAKVNNATPRILSVSNSLVREHPDMVVRYARTLLQAAKWARQNTAEATACMARETGVDVTDIPTYYTPDLHAKLAPSLSPTMLETVEVMKRFLYENGFIEHNFDLREWLAADLLKEAYAAEQMTWQDPGAAVATAA
ncbi:MAG: hypothetical protein VX663_08820 [Pseudomonadota bacterium]|nr:hypothetical protein [Pseudomonadota bacterium]